MPSDNVQRYVSAVNSHYEKFADGRVVCIDDEIPFEIPQGWGWARISSIFKTTSGGTPDKGHSDYYTNGNIPWLRSGELDRQYITGTELMISQKGMENSSAKLFPVNTVAVAMYGATVGQASILKIETTTNQAICGLFPNNIVLPEFLYYFFLAKREDYLGMAFGSGQPNISQDVIRRTLIPIPPFEEQKKIAQQTDAIVALVQRYDSSQAKLDKLNNEINDRLRKSILQEAIQGRLVPQDSNDEPASLLLDRIHSEKKKLLKEGKIKKKDIVDSAIFKGEDNKYYEKIDGKVLDINDEIPFDIPESWTWVRLQQVCTYIHRGKSPKYSEVRKYPVIAQKCNQWDGFHIEKAQFIAPESVPLYADDNLLQDKDLLWNSTGLGTLGRIGLYPESSNPYGFAVADSHVTVIRTLPEFIRPEYLLMFFSSLTVQSIIEDKASGSTKQKELATETVKSYIVPIPPLTEQDRILDKYKTVLESWS